MFGFLLIIVICIWFLNGIFSETKDVEKDGFDIIAILVLCIIILLFGCAIVGA